MNSLRINNLVFLRTMIISLGFRGLAALADPSFTVTEIPTLGGPSSSATALNNAGDVVGISNTDDAPDVSRAFRWFDGMILDIDTFGGPSAVALDINDAGQITGWAETADSIPFNETLHAYIWHNGVMDDLGTTGGMSSRGMAINADGFVVGASQICWIDPKNPKGPCFPVGNEYSFIWDGNMATDLGGLFGSSDSSAFGINSSAQIAGQSITINGFQTSRHAVIWLDGVIRDLGTLGGLNSWAFDINDAGVVTGFSDTPNNLAHHSFIYDIAIEQMIDIGVPPDFSSAEAIAINSTGQIVGAAFNCCEEAAFFYDGQFMYNLNELIPPDSGWMLIEASDINNAGWIVGHGLHNGAERGFLLKPVIETCGSDIDCSGTINLNDYVNFFGCFTGPHGGLLPGCTPADFDTDSDVDMRDFSALANDFGNQ